jgi:dTDP-4-amino-4,6-dideoxygalactose transaminase
MDNKLAILGGSPAIAMDHDTFAQWPIYGEEEVEAVSELIRHHGLSSAHEGGPIVEFERAIAERWGVKHAIAHSSGTAALRSALFGVGVVRGDEVILQSAVHPFTCIPIVGCSAIPVFADIDPVTLTLDPTDVEKRITSRTKAIMVVHWKGMPADMDALLDIANRHGLKVVEDNCVSQGTLHRGRMCGTLGDVSAISFQDGKMTSGGEGGMLLTNSDACYQRAATLGHYERLEDLPDEKYRGVSGFSFGEKYRMATVTAAIGCVQMEHWDERLAIRKENDRNLGEVITEIVGFRAPEIPDYAESPFDRGFIRFRPDELGGISRETLLEALQAEGARVTSPARKASKIPHTDLPRSLHLHPVFTGNESGTGELLEEVLGSAAGEIVSGPGTLPVTEDPEVPYETIALPSFTRPAHELIVQYTLAFRKIALQANDLSVRVSSS